MKIMGPKLIIQTIAGSSCKHLSIDVNLVQDCDDDGEHAAGGRLLHLLQIVDAQNVMVVVTRWYGGVHLGPARFTHINNAARMLLDQEGYIHKAGTPGKKQSK